MEYKNYNEMLEKYGFDKIHTGGGCFYYERNGPPETNFVIVLFTNHRDDWINHEESLYIEKQNTQYDIWVCETEAFDNLEWNAPQYRIKELNEGHELNNEHTLFEEHIQKTIALSESLTLDGSYLKKYGCTHQELLDKYKNLEIDEFKELLRIKQNFPESYCMECGAYTDSVEIENTDCPECGE